MASDSLPSCRCGERQRMPTLRHQTSTLRHRWLAALRHCSRRGRVAACALRPASPATPSRPPCAPTLTQRSPCTSASLSCRSTNSSCRTGTDGKIHTAALSPLPSPHSCCSHGHTAQPMHFNGNCKEPLNHSRATPAGTRPGRPAGQPAASSRGAACAAARPAMDTS